MAKTDNLTDFLTDLADTIRAKKGTSDPINPQNFSEEISNISGGGGGEYNIESVLNDDGTQTLKITTSSGGGGGSSYDGEYLVRVIDYDGSILKEQKLNSGDTFTLPEPPTNHERLLFQEWSSPVDITNNTITIEDYNVTIGAIYTTKSGLSEFDISLNKKTGLTVTLRLDGTKNWGDGTTDTETTHTYENYGDYMITCDGTTMSSSSAKSFFGQSNTINIYHCINIRLANITRLPDYTFQTCKGLQSITLPNTLTTIGGYAFRNNYSLKQMILPSGIKSIPDNLCYYCYSLEFVVLNNRLEQIGSQPFSYCYSLNELIVPDSVTSVQSSAFSTIKGLSSIKISKGLSEISETFLSGCERNKHAVLPNNITSIPASAFYYNYTLKQITIPNSITSIGTSAFGFCYCLLKVDLSRQTQIPSLADTSVFRSVPDNCKIYVPDELYDNWIVETNWSSIADYIYKASEMPTEE